MAQTSKQADDGSGSFYGLPSEVKQLFDTHRGIRSLYGEQNALPTLLNLSSLCLVMVERLFLAVPRGCLRFVIVVFLDHTHLLFLCHLLITFANNLHPNQAQQKVGPDLDPNCLSL